MEVDVPRKITRIGCFSATMFLILGVIFAIYQKYGRSIITLVLYITTCLHWDKMKFGSWIHRIDIFIVTTILLGSVYTAWEYPPSFWNLYGTAIAIGAFFYLFEKVWCSHNDKSTIHHYIACAIHIVWFHLVVPSIYLWGFLNYEVFYNSPKKESLFAMTFS